MRGMPQIEVTFDIDANGILKVAAKDKATGKEQEVTITGSTNLDKGEIDRMVENAKANADEDKKRRQEIETRNEADSLVYQVERQLKDLGDKLPVHEKARVEQLVNDLRAALKENAPIDRVRSLHSDLQQAAYTLSENAYQQRTGGPETAGGTGKGADPNVVDAEYEES